MNKSARLRLLDEGINDPRVKTNVREILIEAKDNTSLFNKMQLLGQQAAQLPRNPNHPLANQAAPGFAAPNVKTTGVSQAEAIALGQYADKPRKQLDDYDRIKFGDKDLRSFLAEEKLKIAEQMAGRGTREELVDMLNADGVQTSPQMLEAYNNSEIMDRAVQLGKQGALDRPEFETADFVGEGQFGRVSELAPGYVIKEQAPLVEFGGYQSTEKDPSGARGELIGRIFDYRDVADDVADMNHLNRMHMGPKVEAFNVLGDGSTEVIMRDLRDNFITGNEYIDELAARPDTAQKFKDLRMFQVQRAQQESAAANSGLELNDRHLGNVMVNKMNNRPMQIDPSGTRVAGPNADQETAIRALQGFRAAGLDEEADIFADLVNETIDAGDMENLHYLAQSGLSRVQKIKQIPDNYTRADGYGVRGLADVDHLF